MSKTQSKASINCLTMNGVITLCFLISAFFIQVTNALTFDYPEWRSNAVQFGKEIKSEMESINDKDIDCHEVGEELVSQQVAKVLRDFDGCHDRLIKQCYTGMERIFHRRVEEILALNELCVSRDCQYLDGKDKEKDFLLPCRDSCARESFVDWTSRCSYLELVKNASLIATDRTIIFSGEMNNRECSSQEDEEVQLALYETIEDIYTCKTKMSTTLNRKFNADKLCSTHGAMKSQQEMHDCSISSLMGLAGSVKKARETFLSCTENPDNVNIDNN